MLKIKKTEVVIRNYRVEKNQPTSPSIDTQAFINSIESVLPNDRKFSLGEIEAIIVRYFEGFVFKGKEFSFSPEYEVVIIKLLARHTEQLNFIPWDKAEEVDESILKKFLLLAYPDYNPNKKLANTVNDAGVHLRREIAKHSKFGNKVKRLVKRIIQKKE